MLLRKVGIVLVATSAGTVMSSYIWLCACVELYLVPSLVLVNKKFVISTKRTHTKLNRLRDIRRRKTKKKKKKKKKLERQPDTFFCFFSLCPDSHFAQGQFRNCPAQGKNSHFAQQSENSHFAQDNYRIALIPTFRRTYSSF